jgi:hypothetical protein
MNGDNKIRPVVIVPVHLARPSKSEIISLRQCGKILGKRDVVLVSPAGLDLGAYRELLPTATEIRVAPKWMSSIQAYNRMMISPVIVNELDGFSHLLLHEPDAIVFSDELDYWCLRPYDYIGALWFEGYANAAPNANILGVGNSGLSLRRLSTARRHGSSKLRWYSYTQAINDFKSGIRGDRFKMHRGLKSIGIAGQLRGAWDLYEGNCDEFWSTVIPKVDREFMIAPYEDAVRFSWELLPERCMKMTNGKLPFGIHAWFKYSMEFLVPYMSEAGVDFSFD